MGVDDGCAAELIWSRILRNTNTSSQHRNYSIDGGSAQKNAQTVSKE
jgi:hypothetical protein